MTKQSKPIVVHTRFGVAFVTVDDAVRILGVHRKTAERWANGTQRMSRERAALLAILSGQVVPMPGWDGFRFEVKRGTPTGKPLALLIAPDGRRYREYDFYPLTRRRERAGPWWR